MKKMIDWVLRLIPAIILLQTLYFKFTAAPESVFIFETLGMEPWGRIGSGVGELVASILLVMPSKSLYGSMISLLIITGALLSHLTLLGIQVQGDGGTLFAMALVVWLCNVIYLWIHRNEIPVLNN